MPILALRLLAVVVSTALLVTYSHANGVTAVKQRAEQAKIQAERYWKAARAIDDYSLGTAYNEIDVPEHSCAIISSLLELPQTISPESVAKDPGLKSRDSEALRVYALSLDNYAANAERLLKQSDYQRRYEWNINCVGKFGISLSASLDGITPEFVTVENDGNVLRILGDIESGTFEKFEKVLNANPSAKYVGLGSAGGSVADALKIGDSVRKHGLSTVLWDNCYSACTLVFLSGVERLIYSPYPKLGFHRVSVDGAALADDHAIYTLLAEYGDQMFSNGRLLVALMQSAGVDSVYAPPINDMCETRIATWIQRVC